MMVKTADGYPIGSGTYTLYTGTVGVGGVVIRRHGVRVSDDRAIDAATGKRLPDGFVGTAHLFKLALVDELKSRVEETVAFVKVRLMRDLEKVKNER